MTATSSNPPVVTHVITDLDLGGAEMVLYRLLERTHARSFSARVISLFGDGDLAADIRALGVPVKSLRPPARGVASVPAIRKEIRRHRPGIVHTWMYHADVYGGLAARGAHIPIIWGLHAAPTLGDETLRLRTRVGLRVAASLSRFVPRKILCCSEQTRRMHERLGYDPDKMVVIPNGFEVVERDPDAASSVRAELGLPSDALLIGRVGRHHRQKDTPTLLRAFARVRASVPQARLVLVGDGFSPDNGALRAELASAGSSEHVVLLGQRRDIHRLNSAFDVVVSSSYSEALPVVLGEAMATATPVVATDVGDSRLLIDDDARLVPPRDPGTLAGAIEKVLELDPIARRTLGERDRRRVEGHYSLDVMVAAYEALYASVLAP